jgi:Protein of unknown function (DUF2848)
MKIASEGETVVQPYRLKLERVGELVIAGWTGRDVAALERHIRELEAIGVKRPKSTPVFYRVAASLLTIGDSIEVLGGHSSAAVECVAYAFDNGVWIGLGSDHTDRKAEAVGVALAKQMCAKPVSPEIWRFEEVAPHWDALVLRSYVTANGERRLYQEGTVAAMRPPQELFRLFSGYDQLPLGTAMFCGTLAVHGEITPSQIFEMELDDPMLQRKIVHSYKVQILPDQD